MRVATGCWSGTRENTTRKTKHCWKFFFSRGTSMIAKGLGTSSLKVSWQPRIKIKKSCEISRFAILRTWVTLVCTCFELVGQVFCERIGMCTLICRGDVVQHLGMICESLIALYLQVILNPCVHCMERQVNASLNGWSCDFHGIYSTSTTCKYIIYILPTRPGCPPAPPC